MPFPHSRLSLTPPVCAPVATAVAALRASYADPARVQTVLAGPLFDVVSVAMDPGLEALDLLLRSGAPLGPVAADGRAQVRRVGFLLPPGTLAAARGFAWWCRAHGMRTASHGDVVALPPLVVDARARLQWLVPPESGPSAATDPALLLAALRRALGRGPDGVPDREQPGCQVSAD
jgi:hypothetical protein